MSGLGGDITPRSAVVVGAGVVGLSTAWFLQDRGLQVTVIDRDEVGSGASWGNAGWLSPGLALPLTSPHALAEGLRGLVDPRAPLSVAARPDPRLWSFLLRFAAHCTTRHWRRALEACLPLLVESLPAYDTLSGEGVDVGASESPIVAGFEDAREAKGLLRELALVQGIGVPMSFEELERTELQALRPQLSDRVVAGVRVDGQRYLDPARFLDQLAQAVVRRGATIRHRFRVSAVTTDGDRVSVAADSGPPVTADVAVIATGAHLSDLAGARGVRTPVRAGRGYSFTVPTDMPVAGPIYLPGARVACTPYRGRLRVAGTMEFRSPDRPADVARADAVVASVRDLLVGVRWDERSRPWVGARPVTTDALPLVGATRQPGVYVAGGHGMWGVTLGPVTGRLLAEQITTGKQPPELLPFDPLR
jgi:D-amino-acid dehydrogenase